MLLYIIQYFEISTDQKVYDEMFLKTVKESQMSAFVALYIWNTHLFLQLFSMISAIFTILIRFDNEAYITIFCSNLAPTVV